MDDYKPRNKKRMFGKIIHLVLLFLLFSFISVNSKSQTSSAVQPFGEGIEAKKFYSSAVDNNNVIWFLTESGIVSFNGSDWILHNINSKINSNEFQDLAFASPKNRNELWIAGSNGATSLTTPITAESETITYSPENSKIVGANVLAIAASKKDIRWFGTDKGISAFEGNVWLKNNYSDINPEDIFEYYPLSTMATSYSGDTLYVGTLGGGILRYYKDDVDAISGASEYAIWGPIYMPSDTVFSVYITPDGTQWIGTDKGVAKHSGYNTLDSWKIYDKKTGLADDIVQAINSGKDGKMYFGTKNGLSVFDGENWTTYRTENGLVSNNILTIAIDKNNVVWLGTNNGVTCIKEGKFISYQ